MYAYTGGIRPGDEVVTTGHPLRAELGPGLLGGVYDGMLRRLSGAEEMLSSDAAAEHARPGAALGLSVGSRAGQRVGARRRSRARTGDARRSPSARSCPTESPVRSNGSHPTATTRSRRRSRAWQESRSRSPTGGRCGGRVPYESACAPTSRCSPDSVRSTSSSRSPEGRAQRCPAASAPARPSCSSRSPSGATPT